MRRLVTGGLAVAALIAGCSLVPGSAAAAPGARGSQIANACFALRSAATGRYVGVSGQGYRADQQTEGTAAAFFWKPSNLRSYLPMDQGGSLLGLDADYGDNTTEQYGTAGARTGKVTFRHAYQARGTFTTKITVTDASAGQKNASVQVRVE